jgi:hypothetical protein
MISETWELETTPSNQQQKDVAKLKLSLQKLVKNQYAIYTHP